MAKEISLKEVNFTCYIESPICGLVKVARENCSINKFYKNTLELGHCRLNCDNVIKEIDIRKADNVTCFIYEGVLPVIKLQVRIGDEKFNYKGTFNTRPTSCSEYYLE